MLLTGIIILLVLAECVAIAEYSVSPEGFNSNSSVVNGTSHATPSPAITKKPVANATTVKPTATATKTNTTTVKTTAAATVKITATPTVYTSAQVSQHLIDIAFDPNTPTISKATASTEKIAMTGSYTDTDMAGLSTFQQKFNLHSSTLVLPDTPIEGSQGNIVINYMPESSLESLTRDTSYNNINTKQIVNRDDNGVICSIYRTTNYSSTSTNLVYLNSDLTENIRGHYSLRGVLYNLGFPGETGKYPDSIFYSEQNSVVNLSPIDWKAVELMYGTKIKNGMSLSTVKSMLTT